VSNGSRFNVAVLFLLFQLGPDRYALEARRVVQVLPLVRLKQFPRAPQGVAGAFNYRGTLAPVIDLTDMALGKPSVRSLSTRIILVAYSVGMAQPRLLGLIAQGVTATIRLEPAAFGSSGVETPTAPYLGAVARDPRGLIQRVELDRLLSASVRDVLFQDQEPIRS
jgi:chemotaxis-related protein WspB